MEVMDVQEEHHKSVSEPLVSTQDAADDYFRPPSRTSAWLATVLAGAGAAFAVLITNISLLVWATELGGPFTGSATIYEGTCERTDVISLWVELAINIVSTTLLGASTLCANLLSSPTRHDLDKAHQKGTWLDIGIPSLRNLKHIPRWRVFLWLLLLASSLPLHLVYNSTIYTTKTATDYQLATVSPDFIREAPWNQTRALGSTMSLNISGQAYLIEPDVTMLASLQKNIQNLTRLDADDCYSAYAYKKYEYEWRNGLIVIPFNSTGDSLVQVHGHFPDNDGDDTHWPCWWDPQDTSCIPENAGHWWLRTKQCPCFEQNATHSSGGNSTPSYLPAELATAYNTTPGLPTCMPSRDCVVVPVPQEIVYYEGDGVTYTVDTGELPPGSTFNPAYCYLEPAVAICSVEIDRVLLLVVVICNAVKIICMLVMSIVHVWTKIYRPIATLGDAIASFLENPDPSTQDFGPISSSTVRLNILLEKPMSEWRAKPLKDKFRAWSEAYGISLLGSVRAHSYAAVFVPTVFCIFAVYTYRADDGTFPHTFGGVTTSALQQSSLGAAIVPNLPQLAITLQAVLYSNFWIRMILTAEFAKFGTVRQFLRVSKPKGGQRSTYWLQMPFTYAVPIMAVMAVIHWLISRAVTFFAIRIYDHNGNLQPSRAMFKIGTARFPGALALTFILSLWSILWMCMMLRPLDKRVPVVGSCSLAIAAACNHAGLDGAAMLRLKYGVIEQHDRSEDEKPRVGFSSRRVEPLEFGVEYT